MSVSKRTRFEVLRRDSHTCQYCGQLAPDVTLHIDHVIPVSLGGSDNPDNLVAACRDCNLGKASIAPDSPIVKAVGNRSATYLLAQANRAAHMHADEQLAQEFADEFFSNWSRYTWGDDKPIPTAKDARSQLKSWWASGIPLAFMRDAIDLTMCNHAVVIDNKFRYFAGVIWRHLDTYDMRYPEQTQVGRVYSEEEIDDHGQRNWSMGYEAALAMRDARTA